MKLGTRLLIFSSIFLVLLPWFGFHFITKIEQSLLQGQEEAQSMTASAISTVLRGYTRLFDADEHALYVYPAHQVITIDGYDEDWTQLKDQFSFQAANVFSLLLTNDAQYLYAYLRVKDDNIVYRNPRYIALDSSDHVRLEYLDENNKRHRLVLLTEGQGNISVYEVDSNWRLWKRGNHLNAVFGNWRETSDGYDLELRLPVKWLEPNRRLSLSVVNVFNENQRKPDTVHATRNHDVESLNPILYQSQEINNVIQNLSELESRICVIDIFRRVRSVIGGNLMSTSLCQAIDKVSESLVSEVLQGNKQVTRIEQQGEIIIVAAYPVFDGEEIIGAVLVSKDSQQILSLQRETLRDVVFATIGLFFLVFLSLLIFSSWLTFRINRLTKQTASLLDDSGRIITSVELSDVRHGDAIGDLSRSFTVLLDSLHRYTQFLETVPSMLRHEILNPVNTLSMSLQKIQTVSPEHTLSDIAVANSAIKQLQMIVSSLTEAANIDQALKHDDVETIDIAALLIEYVRNSQAKHRHAKLRYQGVEKHVYIQGNDIRIVQLLDKVKDNALDFSLSGTTILFQLDIFQGDKVRLSVKNEGEILSQQQLANQFTGMVSSRSVNTTSDENVPHLGIGLFVANRIAQFHQAVLQIKNWQTVATNHLECKQGVDVILLLPMINASTLE
ncbi:MAG: hypothetical protein JKX75_08915 [Gammaproteobacteria bacterium]|nr:hypothetical protein [Gammaproteobacteria bacterium]